MKYAVEQQYLDSGRVLVKIRPATDDEVDTFIEQSDRDVYIDIFESKAAATRFAADAKNA